MIAATGRPRQPRLPSLAVVAGTAGIVLVVLLYALLLGRSGLYSAPPTQGGHEKQVDFVAFYAAGQMARAGRAAAAYDDAQHDAYVTALVGPHTRPQPWFNPPSFLLLTAPLAMLSFGWAKLVFVASSLAAFAYALRSLGGHPMFGFAALAFPSVLAVGISGQNSLLSAALLAGMLLCLDRRPWLAGIFLGVLTMKPQLGLLIPLALVCGGYWATLAAALVTALALGGASAALFGLDSWTAFPGRLVSAGEAMLVAGATPFGKMQSVLGVLRNVGFGPDAAAALQVAFGLAVALFVCRLWWRGDRHPEIRGAALAVGITLVQPYVYIYDEAVLAVAVVLLVRLGLRAGFLPGEQLGIAAACAALLAAVFTTVHLGLLAALIVLALVIRRAADHTLDTRLAAAHNVALN